MYSLTDYSSFIADRVRTDAYVRALRQALRPGNVCLDIGTGTGFFAVLACHLGARKVIAIEPDNAIHAAREVAAANGCAERITFLHDFSTRVQLEERADVIVSDLRGVLPLYGHHLPSLIDARRRFLAPGGALIPQMDTLWAALVEAPKEYERTVPLEEGPVHGVNMAPVRPWLVNSWRKARLQPDQLLAAPRQWGALEYVNLEAVNVRGKMAWTVERPGTAHGLLLWFDTILGGDIGYSNAPGQPELIYGQFFVPWTEAVRLAAGDFVEVLVRADLVGADYVWGWDICARVGGPAGPARVEFRQSTFFGTSLAADQLRKRATSHPTELNEDGKIDCFILTQMETIASVGEVASKVAERFPRCFPTWQEALTRVADLAERYCR